MQINRREFVKAMSAASATVALAGHLSAQESSAMTEQKTQPSPQIIRSHFVLAGVQVIVDLRQDFGSILKGGWERLAQKLPSIPNIAEPRTAISYMHYVDASMRTWFLGVQLTKLEGFEADHGFGLTGWDLGDTMWAVFREQNGAEGSTAPKAYAQIAKMGYGYDSRFIGEFERSPLAWAVDGPRPDGACHDFMLPVRKS
jgi:hypothetical protein